MATRIGPGPASVQPARRRDNRRHVRDPHRRVLLTRARLSRALRRALWIAALAAGSAVAQRPAPDADAARLALPSVGLRARDIAVVVNDADPASVEIARYYAAQRGIAEGRVVHVRFPPGQPVMAMGDFQRVQAVLDAKVDAGVQAFALAWTLPYRVECMSVTAAFALGFDPAAYCADGCRTTKPSPYFNSASRAPFTDHRLRPAMLLAGSSVESVKRLIDRGLRADERWPEGKAYLMNTSDASRNVRAESYERVKAVLGSAYPIEQVDADALEGRSDVMFEFTGVARVAAIAANRFVDGAIADHLTSFGGALLRAASRRARSSGSRPGRPAATARAASRATIAPSSPRSASSWRATSPARRWSRPTGRASSCRDRACSSATR